MIVRMSKIKIDEADRPDRARRRCTRSSARSTRPRRSPTCASTSPRARSRRQAFVVDDGRYVGSLTPGRPRRRRDPERLARRGRRARRRRSAPTRPATTGRDLALQTDARRVPVVDDDGRLVGVVAVTGDLHVVLRHRLTAPSRAAVSSVARASCCAAFVAGWSTPSTRSMSATRRVCSACAFSACPACAVGRGEVAARGQRVEVVGAVDALALGDDLLLDGDRLVVAVGRPQRLARGSRARRACRPRRRRARGCGRRAPARGPRSRPRVRPAEA